MPFGRIPADYLIILILILSSSASFGLGILLGKDMDSDAGTGEGSGESELWIENLEASQKALPAAALEATSVDSKAPGVTTESHAGPSAKAGVGEYVASKNGSKYYLPTCSGVKRIKEENKVWFKSAEQARAEGYEPAVNCPGL